MIAVLVRLQWMTLKGRVVRSIRLLRQPKYAVGFVIGAAWIAYWMIGPLLRADFAFGIMGWSAGDESFTSAIHGLVAILVTAFLPLPWLLPWGALGLSFRESELTLLLQAPLTRRQVIQYGLLKSELGVVFGALLVSFARAGSGAFAWLLGFLGIWILFDFWHVNGRWRALFNLRQREIPVARARGRRLGLTAGLLGFYVLLVMALLPFTAQLGAALRAGGGPERIFAHLAATEWPALLAWLTTPAWWLTAPIFAKGGMQFVAVAIPVLLLAFSQRELVLRSRARFEESALENARSKEARKSATRRFAKFSVRARASRSFELDRPGSAAVAVVWKNAMRVSRTRWTRVALGAPLLLLLVATLPALLRIPDLSYGVLAALGAFLALFQPVFGGTMWNNDLRTELAHLELVRTWPVSARGFVLAEVVSPALLSFAGSSFGAGLVLTSLHGSRLRQALTGEPSELVLLPRAGTFMGVDTELATLLLFASFLPMAGAVSFLSSALQNLAVLFVPAWMAQSADRSQGIAALGQRMVFFSALGVALFLALIPSALLVGAVVLVQGMLGIPWSAWELPLWMTLAAAPLFLAGWLIVQAGAGLWSRLDPSQEVLEVGR